MKKHPKILNLMLILALMLSIPLFCGLKSFAQDTQTTQPPAVQEQVTPKNALKPATIPEKNAYGLTHMEKTGFKYAFFKFFVAMAGVLVSALAIFFGLKFYKKFVLKSNAKLDEIDYDKTLESPKDFKEAINLFLDKTDK
ncbi:MAG: hypothetical protein WCY19_07360 [Candidatus Gastranaerophilaceae bacterium]